MKAGSSIAKNVKGKPNRKKKKPRVIKHRFLEHGDLAYYDSKTRTIHILNQEALYKRILRHEIAHSNSRWLFLNESLKTPPILLLIWSIASATLTTIIFDLHFWRWFGPLGTALVVGVLFLAASQIFYWAEEIRADRVARAMRLRKKGRSLRVEETRQSAHPPQSREPDNLAPQPQPSPSG